MKASNCKLRNTQLFKNSQYSLSSLLWTELCCAKIYILKHKLQNVTTFRDRPSSEMTVAALPLMQLEWCGVRRNQDIGKTLGAQGYLEKALERSSKRQPCIHTKTGQHTGRAQVQGFLLSIKHYEFLLNSWSVAKHTQWEPQKPCCSL